MKSLYVVNLSGDKEPFSFQKVYNSARGAGASRELSRKIAQNIKKQVYPGMRTSEIFSKVKKMLHPKAALRFNLKKAMKKLGPTGFPFEKFIGEILKRTGYNAKINQHLPGYCVRSYEIDFVAQKKNLIYVGECKYRNLPGEKVHSGDSLANYARFLDILNGPFFKIKKYKNFKIKTILVTNTKFTSRAKNYSNCVGVETLGWKIPKNKGLEYLIEKEKLYPVTILPSLNKYLRDVFVSEKIMLVQDILKVNPQKFSKKFKISVKYLYPLIKEAKTLLEK